MISEKMLSKPVADICPIQSLWRNARTIVSAYSRSLFLVRGLAIDCSKYFTTRKRCSLDSSGVHIRTQRMRFGRHSDQPVGSRLASVRLSPARLAEGCRARRGGSLRHGCGAQGGTRSRPSRRWNREEWTHVIGSISKRFCRGHAT